MARKLWGLRRLRGLRARWGRKGEQGYGARSELGIQDTGRQGGQWLVEKVEWSEQRWGKAFGGIWS